MTAVTSEREEMQVSVKFDGPATERGTMEAAHVSAALLGLSNAYGEAARTLYGDAASVRVEVQADFRRGSFEISVVAINVIQATIDVLGSPSVLAILNLMGLTGYNGGVIGLIRWLAGRKVLSTTSEGGNVTVTTRDGDVIVVEQLVLNLYSSPKLREAVNDLTAPLESNGIETVTFRVEDSAPVVIAREEREFFTDLTTAEDEISIDESVAILEVVSPVFRAGQSWRFAQADVTYWAKVTDDQFLDRISAHEIAFGKDDALKVRLQVTTTRAPNGELKYERVITSVLDILKAPRSSQEGMDFSAG